uniref:glucokinase n=1 Tax=Pararhizobium sp. IMCC3301 TaxID=3067904 RepID=UPI002740D8FE|nr:glucokinase [Pararhizobium sp. IMCC3301]
MTLMAASVVEQDHGDPVTHLVCDLGGTSCRLALVQHDSMVPETCISLENNGFQSFDALLAHYLQDFAASCQLSCVVIALAAPITGDCVALTNRDWTLDRNVISHICGGAAVFLINDFEALGHALNRPADLSQRAITPDIAKGEAQTRVILGAGTGFNSAACTASGEIIRSETGHTTLAVETDIDRDLQHQMSDRFGRCSQERILSGVGLVALYHLICERKGQSAQFEGSYAIVRSGAAGDDPCAEQACNEFARILGRTAGDLALTFMAYGGVFLNGGVTRALAPFLTSYDGPFGVAFRNKGRMAEQMKQFPVYLILDDHAALSGCMDWLVRNAAKTLEQSRSNHTSLIEGAL